MIDFVHLDSHSLVVLAIIEFASKKFVFPIAKALPSANQKYNTKAQTVYDFRDHQDSSHTSPNCMVNPLSFDNLYNLINLFKISQL